MKETRMQRNVEAFKKAMLESWEELPPYFLSSAETGRGKEEICDYIEGVINTK